MSVPTALQLLDPNMIYPLPLGFFPTSYFSKNVKLFSFRGMFSPRGQLILWKQVFIYINIMLIYYLNYLEMLISIFYIELEKWFKRN